MRTTDVLLAQGSAGSNGRSMVRALTRRPASIRPAVRNILTTGSSAGLMVCRFDPVQNGGHGIDKHSHEQPRSGIDAVRDRVAAGDSTRGGIASVDRAAVPGRIRAVRSVLVCRSRLNVGRDRIERSASRLRQVGAMEHGTGRARTGSRSCRCDACARRQEQACGSRRAPGSRPTGSITAAPRFRERRCARAIGRFLQFRARSPFVRDASSLATSRQRVNHISARPGARARESTA